MWAPSFAWNYRCNLLGCCCGGWRISLRESDWARLRAATMGTDLGDAFRTGVRRVSADPEPAVSLPSLAVRRFGDYSAEMVPGPGGSCTFMSADGSCRVHATRGEGALPEICVSFPISAIRTPRGVECWFENLCPEVLRAMIEATDVATVTEAPDDFPREVRYFQHDEPMDSVALGNGLETTFQEYDRFRMDALEALRVDPGRPLAVLARVVSYAFRWAGDGIVDRHLGDWRASAWEEATVLGYLADRARDAASGQAIIGRTELGRRLLSGLGPGAEMLERLSEAAPLPDAGAAISRVAEAGPDVLRVVSNFLVAGFWSTPLLTEDSLASGLLRLLRNLGTGLYLAGALAPRDRLDAPAMGIGLALGELAFRAATTSPPALERVSVGSGPQRIAMDLFALAASARRPRPSAILPGMVSGDPEEAVRAVLRTRIGITARACRTAVREALSNPEGGALESPWDPPRDPEVFRVLSSQESLLGGSLDGDNPPVAFDILRRLALDATESSLVLLLRETGRDTTWTRAVAAATLDTDGEHPSRASLAALFGASATRCLGPGSRLVSLGVVHLDGQGDGARARLDPRVAAALDDALPNRPSPGLRIIAPQEVPVGRVPASARLVQAVRVRLEGLATGAALAVFTGPPGLDTPELLAKALGYPVLAGFVDPEATLDDAREAVRDLVLEAILRGALPMCVLEGGRDGIAAMGGVFEDAARAGRCLVALACPEWPAGLDGLVPGVEIPVPPPSAEHLAAVVARTAPRNVHLADAPGIRAALRGLPIRSDQVAAATAAACQRILSRGDAGSRLPLGVLVEEVRAQLRSRIGEFADPEAGLHGLEDLVLPSDSRDLLHEVLAAWRHRDLVLDDWGLAGRMAGVRGLSALFYGPPGTGKTLAAGIIARELGLELFRVDLSRVVDKYVGETGKHLSRVFDEARQGQVLLLFDEADSLFGKRTAVSSSTDRYANLEVNHLLQRMETHEGLVVLTTNHEKNLDEAFLRRLRYRVRFPMPDGSERGRLWQGMIPAETPMVGNVDFAALGADYEMSGGHIRNAVLRAAFRAAAAGEQLGEERLRAAGDREYRDLGRLVRGDASGSRGSGA